MVGGQVAARFIFMFMMMKKKMKPSVATRGSSRGTRQAGFTLVELLITLVVLGIIAAIAAVSLFSALDKARQRATMSDMRTISKALEFYMVDYSFLPDDSGGLAALLDVLRPYQSSVLPISDHWKHPYSYTSDPAGNYSVESFGKDGIDGPNITVANRFDFDLDIVLSNGQFVASPE